MDDFKLFKEFRNKITFWIKIGLGVSKCRQLEELQLPIHKTVPKPPLLTTGYMAKHFEQETETYLKEVARCCMNFYEGLFTEAKTLLLKWNDEMMNYIAEASTHQGELILAKAFRSAVAGSSDLFKTNYREYYPPGALATSDQAAPTNPDTQYGAKPKGRPYKQILSLNIGLQIPRPYRYLPHVRHDSSSNDQTVQYTREPSVPDSMDLNHPRNLLRDLLLMRTERTYPFRLLNQRNLTPEQGAL